MLWALFHNHNRGKFPLSSEDGFLNFAITRIVTYLLKIPNGLLLPARWSFLFIIRAKDSDDTTDEGMLIVTKVASS